METVERYQLELELRQLRELMKSLEIRLKELEYAESVIVASKSERKIFREFSDLLVEITKDEAIEHIERTRLVYKREIERLKERERKILKELAKLKS